MSQFDRNTSKYGSGSSILNIYSILVNNIYMIVFVIKNIRLSKKISLYKLSKQTNLSRTYLRNLENNISTNPTLSVLEKIATALDVNIKELFYTELDIQQLKKVLYKNIDKFGISSAEALEISQIIDKLLNIKRS